MGASRLHIVDLEGAASGEIKNLDIIRDITRALLIPVQLGGGIRSLETIEALLKNGIERVILSTAAVENPQLISEACGRYRDSIVVGIDTREGCVATHGWVRDTDKKAVELAEEMVQLGVRRFVYTDISRDGTLTEPNFSGIAEMIDTLRLPVVAAGGIASVSHLKMLAKLGAEGAVLGQALYTGEIDLKQAIAEVGKQ